MLCNLWLALLEIHIIASMHALHINDAYLIRKFSDRENSTGTLYIDKLNWRDQQTENSRLQFEIKWCLERQKPQIATQWLIRDMNVAYTPHGATFVSQAGMQPALLWLQGHQLRLSFRHCIADFDTLSDIQNWLAFTFWPFLLEVLLLDGLEEAGLKDLRLLRITSAQQLCSAFKVISLMFLSETW